MYHENFLGTQKRVRISHGNRAIGVWVIEVLLHFVLSEQITRADSNASIKPRKHDTRKTKDKAQWKCRTAADLSTTI